MLLYLGMAIQQARGRFALAASAPIVENSMLILTALLAGCTTDPDWRPSSQPQHKRHRHAAGGHRGPRHPTLADQPKVGFKASEDQQHHDAPQPTVSSIADCTGSRGNNHAAPEGHNAPNTVGPTTTPAAYSPMTAGWPIRFIAAPSRRAAPYAERSTGDCASAKPPTVTPVCYC
jgi:hypothetical protein